MSKEKLVTESCHAQGFFGCCCFCFNSTNVNSQSLTSTHQIQFSSNWFYCFACKFIMSLDYLVCLATREPPEFTDRSFGFPTEWLLMCFFLRGGGGLEFWNHFELGNHLSVDAWSNRFSPHPTPYPCKAKVA